MSLFEALSEISEQVKSQKLQRNSIEAATINVSILPFIRALEYNPENLGEVSPEFNADAKSGGGERVDYAIIRDSKPIMFLEVKAASRTLDETNWKQLYNYFNATKVRIGILTNGILFKFYTDMNRPNIMDKQPFLEIDLLNLEKRKVEVLEGFTKARFEPIKSIHYMKISAKVAGILNDPDEWFVKHVIHNIHEGAKWKTVVEEYRPLVKRAIDDFVDQKCNVVSPDPDPIEPNPDPTPDTDLPKPQTWLDGSVKIPIFATWEDQDIEAMLRLRGKVSRLGNIVYWNEKWMRPVKACLQARQTVDPNTQWYVNGMTFWKFRDPANDKLRPIKDLHYAWHDDWDLILRVIIKAST